jgi:signal transduction histidine kinase/HAMP domain-containing protein
LIWLNQVAAEVQLPRGSTFTVIDRNGTILVRYPDPGVWVGRSVPEAPVVERILSQKGEGTTEANGVDGVPRLFAFTLLSGAPGSGEVYVSLGIPTDVAFADANRVLARNLAGLGLAAMLALAAAWVGGDLFILRWVKVLVETTKRLSAGDLSVRTGLPYGRGELSQLAQAFDDMAASLERRVAERDRAEDALRSAFQLLEQRVAERTRELSALYDVTKVASESLNMETILERSLNRVLAAMGSEVGAVHLVDESEGVLRLAAGHGLPSEYRVQTGTMALGEGLTSWVLEHGEPLVLPNIAAGPRPLLALPARDSQAYVAVPIRAKEKILGVLSVVGEMGRQYKSEEVSLLDSIADQVGVALDNARLYRQAEQLAVIKERSRMARELHDSVTQSLYSLTLFAEAGRRLALAGDLNQVSTYLTRLGETARQALKEMRHLVYELRPLDLEQEGLVGALQQRLDAVEGRSGVQTRLLVEAAREVPALVEAQLYRIAQEALNNALKHAEATIVTVRLGQDGEQVVLEVMDDGRGFDPDVPSGRGGLGLTSMRERAERMGGTLAIRAAPGKGTTVLVTVPAASSAFQAVEPAIDPFAVG